MNFQKTNNITGWLTFAIALVVYWVTMEETASYWDCGEFIATSYKLEVSHPPGAPLFMLIGRLFSFLAMGDVTRVAYWINMISVLSSAFTILFLFWTITLFGRKMMGIRQDGSVTESQTWLLVGAGLVGSLAYTFSDSFWFSAVEAEVYALSSFFTAFVVWAMLKWDHIEDESRANRWLLMIAYMMGLSIGIHMLNLVTIPALGLIYYFKKYEPNRWGILLTLMISGALVLFINDFIVPGLPSIAGSFEIFFVNTLGLPFGSGALFFAVLVGAGLAFGIRQTHLRNRPLLNVFLLATSFILIGYFSYATIVIRSNYETNINENAPKDVMSFVRYLKREQYGSRPLLYGAYFNARPVDIEYGSPVYIKGKDRYEISTRKFSYKYDPANETMLPRMWYPDGKKAYERIMNLAEGQQPTFAQNLAYMFSHQISFMYVRYFMWNFAGRESDDPMAAWLTPMDAFTKVPALLEENRGRNNFLMIPFVLGFLGMFFQIVKDTRNFAVVGLLFVMTGVAIVVYLNSPPEEPRARDYIYAGSYYAFALWIGLAVIGIAESLQRLVKNAKMAALAAALIGLSAPTVMALEGWDDHNRANRYFSVDSAKNYLASCAPNAILFTGGDNDTFPLWYAQEVEGFRTDVRVIVLSYYNTDWYIGQTMRNSYESTPFPYTLSLHQYRQGGPNEYLPVANTGIKSIDLHQYLDLLRQDYKGLLRDENNIVPSKLMTLNVNREEVLKKGIIPAGMDSLVVDQMQLRITSSHLQMKDLAMLDVLATSNWDRPIYVNMTSLNQFQVDLSPYVVQEGNAYRILPMRNIRNDRETLVNTEKTYDNMVNKFSYRGLDDPTVYYSDDYRGFVLNQRHSFNTLAEALIDEGKIAKADSALQFMLRVIPDNVFRYDPTNVSTVNLLFKVGRKDQAVAMANLMGDRADEMATYLIGRGDGITSEVRNNLSILGMMYRTLYEHGEVELGKKYEDAYERHLNDLEIRSRIQP